MHEVYLLMNMAVMGAVIWLSYEHVQMKDKLNELLHEQYVLKKDFKLLSEKVEQNKKDIKNDRKTNRVAT